MPAVYRDDAPADPLDDSRQIVGQFQQRISARRCIFHVQPPAICDTTHSCFTPPIARRAFAGSSVATGGFGMTFSMAERQEAHTTRTGSPRLPETISLRRLLHGDICC